MVLIEYTKASSSQTFILLTPVPYRMMIEVVPYKPLSVVPYKPLQKKFHQMYEYVHIVFFIYKNMYIQKYVHIFSKVEKKIPPQPGNGRKNSTFSG